MNTDYSISREQETASSFESSMSRRGRHQGVINFGEEIQWSGHVVMSWQIISDQTIKCSELNLKHFSCETLES